MEHSGMCMVYKTDDSIKLQHAIFSRRMYVLYERKMHEF